MSRGVSKKQITKLIYGNYLRPPNDTIFQEDFGMMKLDLLSFLFHGERGGLVVERSTGNLGHGFEFSKPENGYLSQYDCKMVDSDVIIKTNKYI